MIKKRYLLLISVFFVFRPNTGMAQFINLNLVVEPEISAKVEQSLNFGTQITNTGAVNVALGDLNMGIFSIRAFHTQNLYVSLSFPNFLENENPLITDQIPLNLNIAYNNSGENDVTDSKILTNNYGRVSIHDNTNQKSTTNYWEVMYLYVYGSIDVQNVANGIYEGEIVLSMDYD